MSIPNIIVDSIYGPMIINQNDRYIGRSIQAVGSWAQEDINLISAICNIILKNK